METTQNEKNPQTESSLLERIDKVTETINAIERDLRCRFWGDCSCQPIDEEVTSV